MQKRDTIRLYQHSKLDAQWAELFRIYLARDKRIRWTQDRNSADFVVIRVVDLNKKSLDFFANKNFIVLSFVDLPSAMLGLRPEDEPFCKTIQEHGARLFYLHGEPEPRCASEETKVSKFVSYRLDRVCTHGNNIILTLPLGFCSGSKQNIFYPDTDESTYFVKTARKNDKRYDFDWCWIGAESSRDRTDLFSRLSSLNGRHKFVVSSLCEEVDREKRIKMLNADNKTVPYDKYLDYHRRSKVCISANGCGVWNYKDGEFFANNCFVLRQYHKNLSLNPFSPKDGKQWVVFKTDEVEDKINYYASNDNERERINDAGHNYFKKAINGGWAGNYADMFLNYMNGKPDAFRKVEYCAKDS